MKLTDELKQRIDTYFENISPQDFYNLLISKYGFTEDDFSKLYTVESEQYEINCDSNSTFDNDSDLPLAA